MTTWNTGYAPATKPRRNRTLLFATMGTVLGLLLGIVVTIGVVVWGMSQIAEQGETVSLLPIVEFRRAPNGDVTAHSGNGIMVLPFAGLLLGAIAGTVIGRLSPRK